MKPLYLPNAIDTTVTSLARLLGEVPWMDMTETRREYFMSPRPVSYTYGEGRGVRTYTSNPFLAGVDEALRLTNEEMAELGWGPMNVAFLNCYMDASQHLGFHADDHDGTDHTRPIVVISFGQPREIWWRPKGLKGVVPEENRQLLGDGSMFIMPPGFQAGHEHRIPKGDRTMGPRVSLTFRAFRDLE